MYLNTVLKGLVLCSVVSLPLLMPQVSYSQEYRKVTFQSWNYPDRFIRHRGFLGYIEPIGDELAMADASFKMVSGLAGRCHSFASINPLDHFLRHQNFRLKLTRITDDQLSKEDATFCVVKRLASSNASSFESVNFPGHYIRHSNFELLLNPSDGSNLFRKDATFTITIRER